jgi:hypothetical protein
MAAPRPLSALKLVIPVDDEEMWVRACVDMLTAAATTGFPVDVVVDDSSTGQTSPCLLIPHSRLAEAVDGSDSLCEERDLASHDTRATRLEHHVAGPTPCARRPNGASATTACREDAASSNRRNSGGRRS